VSVPALRERVEEMCGALASMGHDLPGLLRDLQVARYVAPGAQRAVVYGLLAEAYEAALDMLKQTGYVAEATAAVQGHAGPPQHTDDPLRALTVAWHYAAVVTCEHQQPGWPAFLGQGEHVLAGSDRQA
jgi:hypothetical protein